MFGMQIGYLQVEASRDWKHKKRPKTCLSHIYEIAQGTVCAAFRECVHLPTFPYALPIFPTRCLLVPARKNKTYEIHKNKIKIRKVWFLDNKLGFLTIRYQKGFESSAVSGVKGQRKAKSLNQTAQVHNATVYATKSRGMQSMEAKQCPT
jgi:hypothetical protein